MGQAASLEFISSFDTWSHLKKHGVPGLLGDPDALIIWLKTGLVRARAASIVIGNEAAQLNSMVSPEIWADCLAGYSASKDWERGTFSCSAPIYNPDNKKAVQIAGVEYVKSDIDKALPFSRMPPPPSILSADFSFPTSQPQAPVKRGGGRTPKQEWALFWFAVLQISQERRLHRGTFENQQSLRDEIIEMLPAGSLSEDTIEPTVRQIWERFLA